MKQITCPFCLHSFAENCEYVDIGVGLAQCSANQCPECNALENGQYPQDGMSAFELVTNWRQGDCENEHGDFLLVKTKKVGDL